MEYRIEKDALGNVRVPKNAYYGSDTARAVENFQISKLKLPDEFIVMYAVVKKSAAIANVKAGKLDSKKGRAIVKACDEIIKHGRFLDQFVVDAFQAGAGTSTNMNANEVIANRAIEILGGKKGDYSIVHPNDHVNMSQSTNDTFPTVIRATTYLEITRKLIPTIKKLEAELRMKSQDFDRIVKIGRTHIQEAVPMTLGEEFSGYHGAVKLARERIRETANGLLYIPIGGTAIGTGINAGKAYVKNFMPEFNRETGAKFKSSVNVFTDTSNRIAEMEIASDMEGLAIVLTKICNDLRLLTSGPRTAIGEILLPAVQPGSSIMPGKINPSMVEMLNMVCLQVMGNSKVAKDAAIGGQLELNVFMPIMAFDILWSIEILTTSIDAFTKKCVKGIKANEQRIGSHLEMDLELATALNQHIGYSKAAEIANIAYKQGKSIKQVCIEMKVMDSKKLDEILDPDNLV